MSVEDRQAWMRFLEEEDWGFWRRCPFCPRQFPNLSALMSHIRLDHPGAMNPEEEKQ